jgi:predicted transcriptional regulator
VAAPRSRIVTLRIPSDLDLRIGRVARRSRRTKSEVVRAALEAAFGEAPFDDPALEARRQSLLVSGRESEADAIEFVSVVADRRGWR